MSQTDKDLSAWMLSGPLRCGGCGASLAAGGLAFGGRCLPCAGLGGLEFLPSGDAALTRRATAKSGRAVLVLDARQRRNRHERRGTLLEPAAIAAARDQCAADAGDREAKAVKRRERDAVKDAEFKAAFEAALRARYPGCPGAEARTIAEHACEKHSGRVGRTAAAKELDPETVDLAVRAHIRHVHTDYDRLRDSRVDKRTARAAVRGRVDEVASAWRR
jgi:hypothetical protein